MTIPQTTMVAGTSTQAFQVSVRSRVDMVITYATETVEIA